MAIQEQLDNLKQSVDVWNKWRKDNHPEKVDLVDADLSRLNLVGANLIGANLLRANLNGTDLRSAEFYMANLENASLVEADLDSADLQSVNLRNANLLDADLSKVNLNGADLTGANLINVDLSNANLYNSIFTNASLFGADLGGTRFDLTNLLGATFTKSVFGRTIIGAVDLSKTIGLEETNHSEASILSASAMQISRGMVSEKFLRGCGLSDWEVESAKLYRPDFSNEEINKVLYKIYDLRGQQPLQISPLFISYSHGDNAFVDKLEEFLNDKGIRFWRDIHDATSGRLEKQIDRAIRQNPTVVLILSENSIKSDWVQHEAHKARELEKETGRDVLCPVALDDSWKNSSWPQRIMEQVKEYNILDFSKWHDDEKFNNTFKKLIGGLNLYYKK